MSIVSDLEERAEWIASHLKDLDADPTKAGGPPNASGTGSQIDHVGYRKSLLDELKQIKEVLSLYDNDGAWEVTSQVAV